jgi:hypothetical protein
VISWAQHTAYQVIPAEDAQGYDKSIALKNLCMLHCLSRPRRDNGRKMYDTRSTGAQNQSREDLFLLPRSSKGVMSTYCNEELKFPQKWEERRFFGLFP